jgi:uncharacterized protein with PQ loop repeat
VRLPTIHLAAVVGLASVVFAVACVLPQLLRLRKTGAADGVSLPAMANSFVSGVAWTAFGLGLHDPWVTVTSLAGLPPLAVSLVLGWRAGAVRSGLWVPALWAAVLTVVAVLAPLSGPRPLTALLGCSIAWMVVPATVTAWRSTDVSGIAPTSWMLLAADGLVGGAYGLVAGIAANVVYACVAGAGAVAVLGRLAWPRLRRTGVPELPAAPMGTATADLSVVRESMAA